MGTDEVLDTASVDSLVRESEATHTIDLSRYRVIDADAALVLSCVLASQISSLHMIPPHDKNAWIQLLNRGLLFALANRAELISVDQFSPQRFRDWRLSWAPAGRQPLHVIGRQLGLFDAGAVGGIDVEPSLYSSLHASFVNPHRTNRLSSPSLGETVIHWLRNVLPQQVGSDREFFSAIYVIVSELLDNVREHAGVGSRGRALQSFMSVSIENGGVFDYLYVNIFDTGLGIAKTAQSKVDASQAPVQDEELISDMLDGKKGGWGRARGMGLRTVWHTVKIFSGTIRIRTCESRVVRGFSFPHISRDEEPYDSEYRVLERSQCEVPGSAISVVLRIPGSHSHGNRPRRGVN